MDIIFSKVPTPGGFTVPTPVRATEGAAGVDLCAGIDEPIVIEAGKTALIPSGIAVSIPPGYAGFVFGRSGLGIKYGIAPANGVGVIDSDYRGVVGVGLHNSSATPFTVRPGDRIAQLLVMPAAPVTLTEGDIGSTERGESGFGSTGGYGSTGAFSKQIVLASASPRRIQMLGDLGLDFVSMSPDVDESGLGDLPPHTQVEVLAERKASAIEKRSGTDSPVLAADTLVSIDGTSLGKPEHAEDARRMLRLLSGKWHDVYTGLALIADGRTFVEHEHTRVKFRDLTDREIENYVAGGEPLDKAGAYGVQGMGSLFVERIEGDYYNVVGLPLVRLCGMLKSIGIEII